ncbi:TetR/AcrR family transcriptional regulator [Alicyclobacillus herbarius]|uniref:TetR/AcrR family transcriptional regulator n=1 Tax=Alicyclobacillus herbarius TaxID=122960 RepID=UPI000687F53C|nr:TetR/AcrR family transcriptional regulator [Alicyclobacillus herbarius]
MSESIEQWLEELVRLQDNDRVTERQLKVLRAAVEVFAEKGFTAASTSEIAERAGVAEGTIFRHYRTKKDLLLSIVGPVMDEFVAPFLLRDLDPLLSASYERYEDFLRAVLSNRLAFAAKYAPVLRILLQEIPFHPELQARLKAIVSTRVAERIRCVIEYFQARGEIAPLPPVTVIRLTASAILGHVIALHLLFPEAAWDDAREVEATIGFITAGLRPHAGCQAPNPDGSKCSRSR